MGAGIAVVAALAAGFVLFMQQRALRAEIEAERAAAEVARQQAEHKVIADARPQKTRPVEETRSTEFRGKVVYVELSNGFSVPLFEARVKEVGGRSFVVGQAQDNAQDAGIYARSTQWLPVSEVVRMSEFADIEVLRNNRSRVRALQIEQLKTPPH
jgi:HAMP domain-containing protein